MTNKNYHPVKEKEIFFKSKAENILNQIDTDNYTKNKNQDRKSLPIDLDKVKKLTNKFIFENDIPINKLNIESESKKPSSDNMVNKLDNWPVNKFSTKTPIYAFASENLEYLKKLNIRNKKVLTIGSSYDSAINAALLGACFVHNIDVNNNAKHFAHLKHIGIQELNYDDFVSFFMRGQDSLKFEIYEELEPHLPLDTQIFFQNLYKENGNSGSAIRESVIFNNENDTLDQKIDSNPYLQSDYNFNTAQLAIKKLEFCWTDINVIDLTSLKDKYDVINLSNIAEYSHVIFGNTNLKINTTTTTIDIPNHILDFRDKVVIRALSLLKPKGQIMFAYCYADNTPQSIKRNAISKKNIRTLVYQNIEGYNYIEIESKSSISPELVDISCILQEKITQL